MVSAERRRKLEAALAVISLRRNSEFYLTHPQNGATRYVYRGSTGSVTLSFQGSVGGYDKMKIVEVKGSWHYEDGFGRRRKMGKGGFIYVKSVYSSSWSDNY